MTLKAAQLVKGGSTLFLQLVIVLVGLGALAALIRFPQTEGRAAHLSLMEIYLDPGVAYGYLASVPFSWRSIRHSGCWDMQHTTTRFRNARYARCGRSNTARCC